MSTDLQIALLAGGLTIAGIVIGAILTSFNSYLEHKRREKQEHKKSLDQELAVLNGAFALTNFIKARLNDWNGSRNIHDLARLTVAQPYLAKLTDRSPLNSERLMVSLIDLGLQLEALLFVTGFSIGSNDSASEISLADIESCILGLDSAIEVVDLIVTGELPIYSEDELAEFTQLEVDVKGINKPSHGPAEPQPSEKSK